MFTAPRQPRLARAGCGLAMVLVACVEPGLEPELAISVSLTENPDNPFSAWALIEADRDVLARLEYGEDGSWDRSAPPLALRAGEPVQQLVLGLHAGTTTELQLEASDGTFRWTLPAGSWDTAPLAEDWANCEASSPTDLALFDASEAVCTNGPPTDDGLAITCFDRRGRPFWSLSEPGESLFLMRPLMQGGFAVGAISSTRILLYDHASQLQGDISALDLEGRTRFAHSFVNPHGLLQIADGPWAGSLGLLTTNSEIMDDGMERVGSGIVVYDHVNDEVLWDWSILGEDDGQPLDPVLAAHERCELDPYCMHANDLVHGVADDDEQFFWFNLNGVSQVVQVNTTTDAVDWHLGAAGDFELVDDLDAEAPTPLEPAAWMYNAHGLEIQSHSDGRTRVLLFDNGNGRPDGAPEHSRVIELSVDVDTMQAAPQFTYGSADTGDPAWFFADMGGDADKLPDQDGVLFLKGDEDVFIAEIGYPDGGERWRLSCPDWMGSYRLAHFPSLYETTWWYDVER